LQLAVYSARDYAYKEAEAAKFSPYRRSLLLRRPCGFDIGEMISIQRKARLDNLNRIVKIIGTPSAARADARQEVIRHE
jgi:hypothetical protein